MKLIDKLQSLLDDNALLRNIKTIITFLLAFTVTTITQGFIEGFTIDTLLTPTSVAAGIGMWVALEIITNDSTQRSYHENMERDKMKETVSDINDRVKTLPRSKARDWVKEWNKEQHKELIDKKKNEIVVGKQDVLTKLELKYSTYSSVKIPFWRVLKRIKAWRLKKKITKMKAKIERAKNQGVYVPYEPTELEDFLMTSTDGNRKNLSTKDRMQYNAAIDTKKRMRLANLFKATLFFGWQGFMLVSSTSIGGFFAFFLVTTFTLTSTAFTGYVITRWTTLNVTYEYLIEKLDYIKQMEEDIKNGEHGE